MVFLLYIFEMIFFNFHQSTYSKQEQKQKQKQKQPLPPPPKEINSIKMSNNPPRQSLPLCPLFSSTTLLLLLFTIPLKPPHSLLRLPIHIIRKPKLLHRSRPRRRNFSRHQWTLGIECSNLSFKRWFLLVFVFFFFFSSQVVKHDIGINLCGIVTWKAEIVVELAAGGDSFVW